ncbi:MAG: response regulator transcription factor [Saprospiraceae bacterium]|nr:response regulator transcription factor [Saprospiraceae bacterium]
MNNKKILIIDEEFWSIEPAIYKIEKEFGKDSTVYCADGSEGLDMLQTNNFSCIILDIMFPLGAALEDVLENIEPINGGLIILDRIRNILGLKIPVICFTIRDDDEVKIEIKKYTKASHISKLNEKAEDLLISQIKKYIN